MTDVLSALLQQIGATDLHCVHDGHAALECLRSRRYGLVLSDWEMEPINGPQLIEAMRRDPALSDIPVILVTAKRDQDVSWLSGRDGYIVKPFTAQSLRDEMEKSRGDTTICCGTMGLPPALDH